MKLYNTLTRKKEEFIPMDPEEVKIYCCGPTVYNFIHIGNARPLIIFDTLRRYLEYKGWKVKYVQNFTDIDDKMINRANQEGITVKELADRFIAEYFTDARGLNVREATIHPKATENIDQIISLVQTLVDGGHAYQSGNDVYFRTKSYQPYGKLSHMPIEDLEAGARIDVNEIKEDPLDFALWKGAKEGEPFWPSPWGNGRPGWHIECSAMANRYLGKTIDIHGGGQDLTFPHHENEVAQSEAANCCDFARFWVHNGYIDVNNQKMSKSLNNFFTVREVAEQAGYEPIRLFMLSAHYRNPVNYSAEIIGQAKTGLERMLTCARNLDFYLESAKPGLSPEEEEMLRGLSAYRQKFVDAMEDDLNTADALAAVYELVREINSNVTAESSREYLEGARALFFELTGVLGLLENYQKEERDPEADRIEALIAQRQAARKAKDFQLADSIRDQLKAEGIVLEDTPQGVRYSRIKS